MNLAQDCCQPILHVCSLLSHVGVAQLTDAVNLEVTGGTQGKPDLGKVSLRTPDNTKGVVL